MTTTSKKTSWKQRLVLARWLGPWADAQQIPRAETIRRELVLDSGNRALLYRPRGEVRGSFAIAIGVHFNGPGDPRMDRFARVLASAGVASIVPVLRAHEKLIVSESVVGELDEALTVLIEHIPEVKPALLSISFGSFPALRVAAARSDDIGALVSFGGYADFVETVRFCLTGELDGKQHTHYDPLNQPVAFINLIDQMDEKPSDTAALKKAWLRFCEKTWGNDLMKSERQRRDRVARKIAEKMVAEPERRLFLQGTRTEDGGSELCLVALEKMRAAAEKLDPRAVLHEITTPTVLVHGIEDDVIPYTQMHELEAGLTNSKVRTHLTGLFGHSSPSRLQDMFNIVPRAAKELWNMRGIVTALARAGGSP